MSDDYGVEIIRADGIAVTAERRSPTRGLPTYLRSAGSDGRAERVDRRQRRRVPDEILRGRAIDTMG